MAVKLHIEFQRSKTIDFEISLRNQFIRMYVWKRRYFQSHASYTLCFVRLCGVGERYEIPIMLHTDSLVRDNKAHYTT